MMRAYEFEVFNKTSDYAELRFRDGDGGGGGASTRGLRRSAVDELIDRVETQYSQGAVAPRVYSSGDLIDLGRSLYQFLDGDERWLVNALGNPPGAVLRISAEERLRHLPWELLVDGSGAQLAVNALAPFTPVRAVTTNTAVGAGAEPANRPLRVLFMATSPEGVEPELAYEAEEGRIVQATLNSGGTELVVEESGSLEGLRFIIESYGPGYFDVFHLSGHATVRDGDPVFVIEDEYGGPDLASPDDLARAVQGQWPRLVFVSGCLTGASPSGGNVPSMSESLVRAGASAVLGWALPVGDNAASNFASFLYRELAIGHRIDEAVARARQELHAARSPYWHLLRLYADRSDLGPMVTEQNRDGRERVRVHQASTSFLDPETQVSRVAAREDFVGRRRVIQRCLRALNQPLASPDAYEGLVLLGMGGLGKSTLASRLLERMPRHQRVVYLGKVDGTELSTHLAKITLASIDDLTELNKILAADHDLETRLRYLFSAPSGPLANVPCIFVFDNFEDGNLDEVNGEYQLTRQMSDILGPLLRTLQATNSPSRVIITSRYKFPAPHRTRLQIEALETLSSVEQDKMLAGLANLSPDASTDPVIRSRAIDAAAGNPRLLQWLDKIVNDTELDIDALITAIEDEADRFRKEDIFAKQVLDSQTKELQRMLAKVNVVELPIPAETVYAIHDHPDAPTHVGRASALGLLEEGTDPTTGEHRYFVSNVLRPLVRPLLTSDDYRQACSAAARSLHNIWYLAPPNHDQHSNP